jgi:hypothetical protein
MTGWKVVINTSWKSICFYSINVERRNSDNIGSSVNALLLTFFYFVCLFKKRGRFMEMTTNSDKDITHTYHILVLHLIKIKQIPYEGCPRVS